MSPDPVLSASNNPGASACTAATEDETACPAQLYVRQEMPDGSAVTRWISRPADGLLGLQQASLLGRAWFEGASADGDKVFFRTNTPLTADDPNGGAPVPGGVTSGAASSTSFDLYMYDLPDAPGADPGDGTLTRITGGPDGAGDCNSVPQDASIASLRFASEAGDRVYFTCQHPLPGVPAPANGTITSPGDFPGNFPTQTNLYLYDANRPATERWRFLASIPRSTSSVPAACASTGGRREFSSESNSNSNCVRGTEDGSFITFLTPGRLTADDPDAASLDIYGYDAEADRLTRLSAPENPAATTYSCGSGQQCFAGTGSDSGGGSRGATPNPKLAVVTEPAAGERVAFFQSAARLVAEDQNDVHDVYQWRDGDLSLVTTGAPNALDAVYGGNSADGRNVYFATREALTWQDVDVVNDIYTARVGGGIPEPPATPVCAVLDDACQGAPVGAPAASGAASGAFSGQGNFVPRSQPACRKSQVRRGNRCVAKRALARRACAKRKGKAKSRCVRKQVRRLTQVQKRQQQARTANANRRAHR